MGRVIDLKGQTFGRWSVRGFSHQVASRLYWHCECQCGGKRPVWGADLKRGGSISCGCHMREVNASRIASHGLSYHPVYRHWIQMKARCENANSDEYFRYGGRGISVCPEWASFEHFFRDMGSNWKKGLTLDRVDPDGDYELRNCRWATRKEQANNRRYHRVIDTPHGQMNVSQASDRYGIPAQTITARLRYGWPADRLLTPVDVKKRKRRSTK